MSDQYLRIQQDHLKEAWSRGHEVLAEALPAKRVEDCLRFKAFGEDCDLCSHGIKLSGQDLTGPEGILIALYARHVKNKQPQLQPLASFKELPNSGPYQAAFVARSEQILVPHVPAIYRQQEATAQRFSGSINADAPSGDFSFTLYPLPRVPLYYIFYLPDEEFPAAVTCLFAGDAANQLTVDGLADVAEYTAKRLTALLIGS